MANNRIFLSCGSPEELQRAIDLVRHEEKPAEITLQNGAYRLEQPIQIHNCRTPIHIHPAEGGDVCLTTAQRVTAPFQPWKDGIYFADIGKGKEIEAFFVNGERYTMCRYPNEQLGQILDGYAADALSAERIAQWSNPAGGYVRALHEREWGGNSFRILGKNPDGSLQLDWVGDNNRGAGRSDTYVMVENIFEELDTPGEWFYHKEEGRLYVMFREGTEPQQIQAEYAAGHALLDIQHSSDIQISGLSFQKTNRTLFNSTYEKRTRSDWCIAPKGAVFLEGCAQISFSDCSFREIGSNCIYLKGFNESVTVSHCDFTHCGASGIVIFGDQEACRELSTWEQHKTIVSDKEPGPQAECYPRDITVESCYFYDLGRFEKQSAAVTLSVASHVTVRGNTIHHLPRAGINICDGCFGGHKIEDNDLFDCVRETGDHGPFNSWGRDRFWSLGGEDTMGRRGKAKKPYALLDAIETTHIHHNRITGHRGFGIDLDDGSSNYEITENLCYGVGIKLREGFFRTVRNNLLMDAPLDLHATYTGNDDRITHNVILCSEPLRVVLLHAGYTTEISENLFYAAHPKARRSPLLRGKHNLFLPTPKGDPLEQHFPSEISFRPISLQFGREGCPQPPQHEIANAAQIKTVKQSGGRFSEIDETRRSLCGLPDLQGVYVERLSILSPLYRRGIRKGDVIRKAGATAITLKTLPRCAGGSPLTIFRGQQQLQIK